MRIEHRDRTLTSPRAIHAEKRRLVLDWLLEFRFSSITLLAQRIGSTRRGMADFFRALVAANHVQSFTNVYTDHHRLLMLTRTGATLLHETAQRPIDNAHLHVKRMHRYAHILHDLAVQRAVLKRLDDYDAVIWDQHIQIPEQHEKPDLLMRSPKGFWMAFEYERSRKENKRIYISLLNHARAIINRHYSGVFYLFERQSDLVHYKTLYDADEWPEYHYNRKTGTITSPLRAFKPDSVKNLRKCFFFSHEPYPDILASP